LNLTLDKNIRISFKQIALYLAIGGITLYLGFFLKNGIGILSFWIFLIFLFFSKNKDNLLLFIIFWLFLYNYYVGQGWITNNLVLKYLIRGQLYVLITFLFLFSKSWIKNGLSKKLLKWAIILTIIILLSNLFHLNFQLSFINRIYFILLFILILNLPQKRYFETRLFNLIIALGILEVIVSFLQVNQVIAPPQRIAESHTQIYLWVAALDDVASGTFGAMQSNVTSWFETVLFLVFFGLGVYKKKIAFIVLSFIFIMQYVTVDSKTALGVTALSFLYLLYRLKIFNFLNKKNIKYIILISIFLIIAKSFIAYYYTSQNAIGTEKTKNYVEGSVGLVFNYIPDWGKIAGFRNITKDYIKNYPSYFLIGYGIGNFTYNTNSGRIEDMDIPIMQLNNITRSRSSLISAYGNLGIPGLFMVLWLFVIFYKDIKKQKFYTVFGASFKQAGIAVLFGSIIFMFLYGGHHYNDLAFQMFIILYALVKRVEVQHVKTPL